MGLISKTIPGFYNGLSQQAAPMRLPTQCEDQYNCYSNLVDGLTKRPNSEHLALLTSNAAVGCMVHGINMSASEQYIMIITGDEDEPVEVFRQDTGVKCSIRYGVLNQETDRTYCSAAATNDTIDATAHGLEDGQQIDLDGDFPSTDLESDTAYYVVSATANAFKVAATSGGTPIGFTAAAGDMTFLLKWTEDDGVKGYFSQTDSLEPNQVFKAITLAETTHILNTKVVPRMTGETASGEIAGRVQTITDLPTGVGIPAADTSTVIVGDLSYETQLAADEAGTWVTFDGANALTSTGHITFKMYWESLIRITLEGATRLEFQWVVTGAGWTAPNITYGWFFGMTLLPQYQYFRLPITAGNWDVRVRRVGSPNHVIPGGSGSFGTKYDCNWQGCQLKAWSTGADIYEITGAADSSSKSYYLQHDGDVWLERLKPGLKNKLAAATMPHILELTNTNEFTFSLATWGDRTVGDNDTAPLPSFVDEDVTNITFFKDRLGLLSEENVVLSKLKSENYYDFFPTSSIEVLDDDPIDISATSGDIVPLRSSMVYDKDLVLFSDQKQFTLSSGDKPLTPSSATITPTTNYDICRRCEPAAAGANVYFVSPKLDYVSLREYMILPDSLVTDAADITAHVPNYIPNGDLISVKALNAFDCLFIWSAYEPSSVFVYKFYWLGNEKPQSSWSKWSFTDDVLGIVAMSGYLTVVVERENGEICLEKIYMEPEQSGNLTWRVFLDRRETLTGVYEVNLSTMLLNYNFDSNINDWTLGNGATLSNEASGYSGKCLGITDNGTSSPFAYATVDNWTGDQIYTCSFMAKSNYPVGYPDAKRQISASVVESNDDNTVFGFLDPASALASTTWTEYSFEFTVPVGEDADPYLKFMGAQVSGDGYMLMIDEINIIKKENVNKTFWTTSADMLTYSADVSLASAGYVMVDEDTGFSMPDVTIESATVMSRTGDYSGKDYLIGKPYDSYFDPTPWYLRDSKDEVITEGRIQVRSLTLSFTDTAYFTVEVTPKGRSVRTHEFNPDTVGVSVVDEVTLETGERTFPIMAQVKDTSIRIANDSYLPMQFSVGSWKGSYHAKAKAI